MCWCCSGDLTRLWRWLNVTGLSREEYGWKEESVRQVRSNLTSLHAISLLRWLFVTVNYIALLPQHRCNIKKQGFDANCCSSIFCSRQPEGPKAPFSLHCSYSNEQFQRKTGQCTLTAFMELKQQDDIFPLGLVWSKDITNLFNNSTRNLNLFKLQIGSLTCFGIAPLLLCSLFPFILPILNTWKWIVRLV